MLFRHSPSRLPWVPSLVRPRLRARVAAAVIGGMLSLSPAIAREARAQVIAGDTARAVADSVAIPPLELFDAPDPSERPNGRRDEVLWVAGAGALLGTAALLDRRIEEDIPEGGGKRLEPASDFLNHFGRPQNAVLLLAGTWVAGKVADRPALARGSAHVLAALAVAGVANGALKFGVGRGRPNITDDPHRFRSFNGDNEWQAFPSGHATVAFSLAAAVSEEARKPWVTALTYGTATAVAWSRVYEDKHWTSDVVGGALVGIAAGRGTVALLHRRRDRQPDAEGPRITLLPGGVAVSLSTR